MAGGRDARGEVDVVAHVALVGDESRPRVQPDPHPDRARRQPVRDRGGGVERNRRRREGGEELVALCIHLDPAQRSERTAHDPPVLGEGFRVAIGSQLVQELRRALDVRDQKRDGATWKVPPHRTQPGGMFWFRRSTLSGSKRLFSACSRSNASSPKAARTRSIGSSACM